MATSLRWSIHDLDAMPEDGNLYEIIDGELYVSTQPHWGHQAAASAIFLKLGIWNGQTGRGSLVMSPGVIFADDEAVAPDIVWVSADRLPTILRADGKLHAAPDLAVELLSPGAKNEQRDRVAKLKLYSRRGVREYWIVDWQARYIDVYRRVRAQLHHVGTYADGDTMESPLLTGFREDVTNLLGERLPTPTVDA